MSQSLKDHITLLKKKLDSVQINLDDHMKDVEERQEKWNLMDPKLKDFLNDQSEIIRFNVGGKKFATRTSTLLKVKDTLFEKMIISKKFDFKNEIFLDRDPKLFLHILDYFRNGKIKYELLDRKDLEQLLVEAQYFEIGEISNFIAEKFKIIDFVRFEFSGPYNYSNSPVSSNRLEDLKDTNLTTGICANTPGYITIELNNEWEFQEIEIAGWTGNSSAWYAGNGSSATIYTSKDNLTWVNVGTVPSNFGATIISVSLIKSTARFIKFQSNSYLGLGYLNIKKTR